MKEFVVNDIFLSCWNS